MKVLDLFSGAGGAAVGIKHACPMAEITGVDSKEQPHYPFTFVQADALAYPLEGFDFIWASPPCHAWVDGVRDKKDRPDCLTPIRPVLREAGVPYAIENVDRAPLRKDLELVGEMFGLRVWRRRIFECSFPVVQPRISRKRGRNFHKLRNNEGWYYYNVVTGMEDKEVDTIGNWKAAMGVDWECTKYEIAQMVPPAYSRYIFDQFLHPRFKQVKLEAYLKEYL